MKTIAKTKTTACTETAPDSRMRECLPCDMPPFCRNHYYTGKLLTERDLSAEQRYLIDKLRLHHLALHGYGVVCGLKVKPHPYCPELRLIVEPGLAIDGCGREIWVREPVEIPLPKLPEKKPPVEEPCPPESLPPKPYGGYTESGHEPYEPEPTQPYESSYEEPHEPPVACEPTINLYLCVRYAECETEFTPAPFDECACNGNSQRPNRICETFKFEWLTELPDDWEKIKDPNDSCETGDCQDLYKTMIEPCPAPGAPQCIPLAVIYNYIPGEAATESMIDNWIHRPLLPSTRLLDRLIRCILEKLPTKTLTPITDINWTHNAEYHCHEFMRLFVGDTASPKYFELTFGAPVRTEQLSTLTFQAIVLRHQKGHSDGGVMEVAPAKVWASGDRTRFYLQIDPAYAQRCLAAGRFDMYLTLRCNVIVDDCGMPVDGSLLAKRQSDGSVLVAPPTGDGIPGGLFESWIRVPA